MMHPVVMEALDGPMKSQILITALSVDVATPNCQLNSTYCLVQLLYNKMLEDEEEGETEEH